MSGLQPDVLHDAKKNWEEGERDASARVRGGTLRILSLGGTKSKRPGLSQKGRQNTRYPIRKGVRPGVYLQRPLACQGSDFTQETLNG